MRKVNVKRKGQICKNETYPGESIEEQLVRITKNNEPIEMGTKPPLFTRRRDGVIPISNIRNDKWESAITVQEYQNKVMDTKVQEMIKARSASESTGGKPTVN